MIPKGSGSENNSCLKMAIPAEGVDAIKTFVVDCVLDAGGKTCPPTIVGVGVGGTSDLCVRARQARGDAAARHALRRSRRRRAGEGSCRAAVNQLGVGPQGLGGDSTAFAVHVELAATHITMNPVAVNMQCHSARRASATFTPAGVELRVLKERAMAHHELDDAGHRGAGARAARQRHGDAAAHALRHPRRDADPHVRPRPQDALRPARATR